MSKSLVKKKGKGVDWMFTLKKVDWNKKVSPPADSALAHRFVEKLFHDTKKIKDAFKNYCVNGNKVKAAQSKYGLLSEEFKEAIVAKAKSTAVEVKYLDKGEGLLKLAFDKEVVFILQ